MAFHALDVFVFEARVFNIVHNSVFGIVFWKYEWAIGALNMRC